MTGPTRAQIEEVLALAGSQEGDPPVERNACRREAVRKWLKENFPQEIESQHLLSGKEEMGKPITALDFILSDLPSYPGWENE